MKFRAFSGILPRLERKFMKFHPNAGLAAASCDQALKWSPPAAAPELAPRVRLAPRARTPRRAAPPTWPNSKRSPMRILLLGNSLTSANDMPQALAQLAGAEARAHTRGGARLAEHLNPATRLGAATQAALAAESWDFVVLQETSNGPVLHRAAFLRSSAALCEQVQAAGAVPVLFATWAYRPGSAKLARMDLGFDEMAAALASAYREAAVTHDALLADVGARYLACAGAAELYAADGVHPSPAGSLMAAQTIAEAIAGACGVPTPGSGARSPSR